MNAVPWRAEQAERDIAGAAVASVSGARLVADLVDLNDIFDLSVRRVVEHAIALPSDVEVDVSRFDDGLGVIGPNVIVDGQAITDSVLTRIVATALATDAPLTRVAQWVTSLPCDPCHRCVGAMAAAIEHAAQLRIELAQLDKQRQQLLEGMTTFDVREMVS